MALVSHRHRFIYLKTFKTGGTSTEMALERLCTPDGHEPRHGQPTIITAEGIVAARLEHAENDTTGWRNHMPAAEVRDKLGAATWDDYLKVVSIRNPFDKAVSWFWFEQKNRPPSDESDPVSAFRTFLRKREENGFFKSSRDIDWRVCTIDGAVIVDRFIHLEDLQADLTALFDELGADPAQLAVPHVKAETRKRDGIEVPDYFDAATADILRRNQDWLFEAGGYSADPRDAIRASDQPFVTAANSNRSGWRKRLLPWR